MAPDPRPDATSRDLPAADVLSGWLALSQGVAVDEADAERCAALAAAGRAVLEQEAARRGLTAPGALFDIRAGGFDRLLAGEAE